MAIKHNRVRAYLAFLVSRFWITRKSKNENQPTPI